MEKYTVVIIKDFEDYAYDSYKQGTTINEIVDDLTYFDEIVILDVNDDEPSIYCDIVIKKGELETHDIYIKAPTIDECFEELVKHKDSSVLHILLLKNFI